MPDLEISQDIIDKAAAFIAAYTEWCDDDWQDMSDDWDLNLYLDEDGDKWAVLYPVVDGQTVTTPPGIETIVYHKSFAAKDTKIKKLEEDQPDLIAMLSHACQTTSDRQLEIEFDDLINEIHELCDRIDPSE
jgi:hypothetical protein